jgi:hypothetical protein
MTHTNTNILYIILLLLFIVLGLNCKIINYQILIIIFICLFLTYCIYKQIVIYENYKSDPNIIELKNIFTNYSPVLDYNNLINDIFEWYLTNENLLLP